MKKKYIVYGVIILVIAAFIILTVRSISESGANDLSKIDSFNGEISLYKSQSCGCCSIYYNYLKSDSNVNVKMINQEDLSGIKKQYGVPLELQTCHTSIIGGYFVEGHVPLEAVVKLLTEKPDIKGIALPGMPSGSPGMTGSKTSSFIIYSVNKDGSTSEFMRI